MKKIFLASILSITPTLLVAQSAIDAYQLSQGDLKGTARFVSMGGAFGALGGDLSTLTQNPAGIGVYRSSEIGVTLDINMQSTKSNAMGYSLKEDQTKVLCPNFGYVGSIKLDSELMPIFNWGISFGRIASFDRIYRGGMPNISTSISNYIADFSNGYAPEELLLTKEYNPYWESNADWLSILAYNSYMINPIGNTSNYNGLFQNGTIGDAMFAVREQGSIDEYSINFGGNFVNTVYWGIGIGITDLDYFNQTFYDEQLVGAQIADESGNATTIGDAYIALDNIKHISGTGFNFKAGLIFKPINELRLGLAVHTPTYYDLRHDFDAVSTYEYSSGYDKGDYTEIAIFDSQLRTPWRLMASAATVLEGRAIISFDYEYVAYNDMTVKDGDGYSIDDVNSDIDNYFKSQNIFRVGAEYRLTPKFSLRAGYNYQASNVKNDVMNGDKYIYTSGTNPAYTFDNKTQYITCGLGYRTNGFYIDAAYVHKNRESEFNAFSRFGLEPGVSYDLASNAPDAPKATIKDNNNSIVLSVGYKF